MNKLFYLCFVAIFCSCVADSKQSDLLFKNTRGPSSTTSSGTKIQELSAGNISLRLGDRIYIYNKLLTIFGSGAESTLSSRIFIQANVIGGGCDPYDIIKTSAGVVINTKAQCYGDELKSQLGIDSTLRQGWIVRACEEITSNTTNINFALKLIFPEDNLATDTPIVTRSGVEAAYALFYNQDKIKAETLDSIFELKKAEQIPIDQWKLIFAALCVSPDWQLP